MKPYYGPEDGIVIYHGDCRELLPVLGRFDLLLTDPPYGIGYCVDAGGRSDGGSFQGQGVVGDDEPFDPRPLMAYSDRLVLFGANYFAHFLPPGGWIVWSKAQDNRWSEGRASCRSLAEVAWTNCHKHVALYNCFWAGSPLYRQSERGSQLHPTQKPVELMLWIVRRLSKANELICDPYMGSGSIAAACAKAGRRYIGIEIEERYCEIAAKRLSQRMLPLSG